MNRDFACGAALALTIFMFGMMIGGWDKKGCYSLNDYKMTMAETSIGMALPVEKGR